MKILYFISLHNHGRGGHVHSLNHISQKIGENNEVKIISFGPGKSSILASNPNFLKHIAFNGLNLFKLQKVIKNESRVFNPDIYHCFDDGSYNIVRLIIPSNKNTLVLNKCGGPNPKYFPHVKNLILFSVENQEWFKNQNKYKNTNVHLIPNRVKPLQPSPDFNPIEKNPGDFIFMRICRIGHTYKKSIQDSINLISKLLEYNMKNVKLYLIGVVQDADVFEKFNNHELSKSGYMVILTESKYTNEASKMLYLADAVIGTGRGLMEAASLGKPMLAINKNGETPVLLNELNFEDAFKTNFSERNIFSQLKPEDNFSNIQRLMQKKKYYNEISEFAYQSFSKYFNLNAVSNSYPAAYKNAQTGKRRLILDLFLILKSILRFFLSSLILKHRNNNFIDKQKK